MTAKPQTEPTLAETIANWRELAREIEIPRPPDIPAWKALREGRRKSQCADDLVTFHARLTALADSLECSCIEGLPKTVICAKHGLLAQLGVLKP